MVQGSALNFAEPARIEGLKRQDYLGLQQQLLHPSEQETPEARSINELEERLPADVQS
jgi:Fe-S cluster assembly ATPase SufC